MQNILIAILPIVGVVVGAFLQHFFSKSQHMAAQLTLRKHECYAAYLSGVATLAHKRSDEVLSQIADAKARMSIYGSAPVLNRLAAFKKASPNLQNIEARELFLLTIEEMRKDSESHTLKLETDALKFILFGSDTRFD